jgi:hypothetical protein
MTEQGWNEEEVLIVTRMFGQTVKEWLTRDGKDWERLKHELGERYSRWSATDSGQT